MLYITRPLPRATALGVGARPISEIDRLFAQVFGVPADAATSEPACAPSAPCSADAACAPAAPAVTIAPAIEIAEASDAYVVRAEVPGLAPDDVQVSVEDDVLTIRGEKKSEHAETDGRVHRTERAFGTYARSVQFPEPVVTSQVTAVHRNGVLTVRLPKQEKAKATQVKVQTVA